MFKTLIYRLIQVFWGDSFNTAGPMETHFLAPFDALFLYQTCADFLKGECYPEELVEQMKDNHYKVKIYIATKLE